jgi:hypothetical protein
VRAGRGVNPKYAGDVWQLNCSDGVCGGGFVESDPASAFISFR